MLLGLQLNIQLWIFVNRDSCYILKSCKIGEAFIYIEKNGHSSNHASIISTSTDLIWFFSVSFYFHLFVMRFYLTQKWSAFSNQSFYCHYINFIKFKHWGFSSSKYILLRILSFLYPDIFNEHGIKLLCGFLYVKVMEYGKNYIQCLFIDAYLLFI